MNAILFTLIVLIILFFIIWIFVRAAKWYLDGFFKNDGKEKSTPVKVTNAEDVKKQMLKILNNK